MSVSKNQPNWVCGPCGLKWGNGWPKGHLGTWHDGKCGVCGKEDSVTEPRDFGYLRDFWDFDLRRKEDAHLSPEGASPRGRGKRCRSPGKAYKGGDWIGMFDLPA